jgi:anhydro-N-acetylmuramic acid kinase
VRAVDTGPGVAGFDGGVRARVSGAAFDVDGALAARGRPIQAVLERELAHPYFAASPPKSTGRELFSRAYIERFIAECRAAVPAATAADIVATAVELTARSIGDALRRHVAAPVAELVLSGGGARNPALVAAIARAAPCPVRRFDELFFDGEAKEAVAFALLAHLHVRGRAGNVPSATGARGPRILGKWTPA